MSRIAVDVVLLPDARVVAEAVRLNIQLVKQFGDKIVLDNKKCLPHISLAMGCIDRGDLPEIEITLRPIAEKYFPEKLSIAGISLTSNAKGQIVSSFVVGKDNQIIQLHEKVMTELKKYFSYDVTEEMLYGQKGAESSLLWVRNFPGKSSFEKFYPHITLGYGRIEETIGAMEFKPISLAVCHLGDHCTCREVLIRIS